MPPFSSSHVSKRILGAAALVAVATVIGKAVGMFKEVVSAAAFGTGDQMDAFVIALTVPAYIINVASGSLNVALIPTYIQVRDRESRASAQELLTSALFLNITLLAVLAAILALTSPYLFDWIASDFSMDKRSLSISMFFLLLPCVLISGLSVTLEAVLNAENRFFGAGLAPAIVPLVVLLAVLGLAPQWGATSLAIGTIGGYVGELIFVWVLLRRASLPISLRWTRFHPALRQVLEQYVPAVSGSSLMCSAVLIDQAMAASLGSGSVSALNYGNKMVAFVVGGLTMALGTAVLPFFSSLAAKEDWKELYRTLNHYVWLVLLVTVPMTLGFVWFSDIITRLLYQRGAFTAADTSLVSHIQIVLALQIPFHTLGILFVRMISSLKLNFFMLLSNILSVMLKIGLNYAFMYTWGVTGIALSTVFVYFAAALFMGVVVYRRLRTPQTGKAA